MKITPENVSQVRRKRFHFAWFGLLAVALGLMIVLAACGGAAGASAGSTDSPAATPTPAATTPVATNTPATATPTPTVKATPLPGLAQVVLIVNNSDGSFGFSPATLTIRPGTTVTWKNMSSAPHTVTSDDGQTFDSGTIPPGGSFTFKFTVAGSYPYHCNIHPYMRATVNL
jgi:plastocyanin